MKIKVGGHLEDDPRHVALIWTTEGDETELFVEANGVYSEKEALQLAEVLAA